LQPYALVIVNALVAFLIGLFAALLIYKSSLSEEYRAALLIVIVGMFATLSSLYVVLYCFTRYSILLNNSDT
jgi:CrcB protein